MRYSYEFKRKCVEMYRKGILPEIPDGMLYQWVRKYKIYGYNGLIPKQKGRKPKNPDMKKSKY